MKRRTDRSAGSRTFLAFLLLTWASGITFELGAQQDQDSLLLALMHERPGEFEAVLNDPGAYRIQILYTQIDRDVDNAPVFRSYSYRVSPEEYFYPASSIKVFGAALALEKLNRLGIPGLNKDTWVRIDSSYSGQEKALTDTTSASGRPSLGHYIKKLFVISDNDAYNRTYEFLGQDSLNLLLRSKGYDRIRLTHRLSVPLSAEQNRHTNPMEFYSVDPERVLYQQAAHQSTGDYTSPRPILLGTGHQQGDTLIREPMDFSRKNYCPVTELQQVLKALIFPETLPAEERFDLSVQDYVFLRTYMSQLPRETEYPDYSGKPDNYCKFFMYGDDEKAIIPSHIRIFNKIGLAYGFCIDNAYIVDFEKNIEFLLTAVIYANENQVLNDGNYEYESVAFPFLARLGRMVYDYELKRPRPRTPDLEAFKMNYDKPTIK